MSNQDTLRYKQMLRNIPKVESIPKYNPIWFTEVYLKTGLFYGFGALLLGAFAYKISSDLLPGFFNPTTKKFMAVPDFTSKQVHVYYREVPNRAHEY